MGDILSWKLFTRHPNIETIRSVSYCIVGTFEGVNFCDFVEIRFSWRKLSWIARWCRRQKMSCPSIPGRKLSQIATKPWNSWESYLPRKFPARWNYSYIMSCKKVVIDGILTPQARDWHSSDAEPLLLCQNLACGAWSCQQLVHKSTNYNFWLNSWYVDLLLAFPETNSAGRMHVLCPQHERWSKNFSEYNFESTYVLIILRIL